MKFHQFVHIAAGILLITGAIKYLATIGDAPYLSIPDPVFLISNRSLFLLSGILEMSGAIFLLNSHSAFLRGLCILWFSISFLLYRGALYILDPAAVCPCLGNLGQRLPLGQVYLDQGLLIIACCLWSGSIYFLLKHREVRVQKRRTETSRPSAAGGFTLIELLVVVAIMAVLASLLLPALSRARDAAYSAVCKSNVRQIGLSLATYVSDFGSYPVGGSTGEERELWFHRLAPYSGDNWPERSIDIRRNRRKAGSSVFACPAFDRLGGQYDRSRVEHISSHFSDWNWLSTGWTGSYGYNVSGVFLPHSFLGLGAQGRLVQGNIADLRGAYESQVRNPADMITISDALLGHDPERYPRQVHGMWYVGPVYARTPSLYLSPYRNAQTYQSSRGMEKARHRDIFNVVFSDGHVEGIRARELFDHERDQTLRRWNIDNRPHRLTLLTLAPVLRGPY